MGLDPWGGLLCFAVGPYYHLELHGTSFSSGFLVATCWLFPAPLLPGVVCHLCSPEPGEKLGDCASVRAKLCSPCGLGRGWGAGWEKCAVAKSRTALKPQISGLPKYSILDLFRQRV